MGMQLEPGKVIAFRYPSANVIGYRPRYERRRIRIDRIRDLEREPLDPLTVAMQPLVNRGKTLVCGVDLDRGCERSFYAERMLDIRPAELVRSGSHRVVLIDPAHSPLRPELVHVADTADEAIACVREWLRDPLGVTIGIEPPGDESGTGSGQGSASSTASSAATITTTLAEN